MKIFGTILGILAVGAVIACVAIHRHTEAERRQHAQKIADEENRLKELSDQNRQLATSASNTGNLLSTEQARELAKLRGQIRPLREAAVEQTRLEATNAQLHTAVTEAQRQLAAAQAQPNYWPKDQLAFAGYADPESAMKSMLWAMNQGDVSAWRSGCTPKARLDLEREWRKHGLSEEQGLGEMRKMCTSLMAGSSGFHIVDTSEAGPETVAVNLSFDGEGKVRQFVLRKIGDEWKFHDLLVAGQGRQNGRKTSPP